MDPNDPNPNKYNPNPNPAPYFPPMPMPPQQRSAIPKVIGILMIIFGSLALLSGFIGLVTGGGDTGGMFDDNDGFKTFMRWSQIFNLVGLIVAAIELMAGLKCLGYKESGPKFALVYAITNIVSTITWGILVFTWLKPMMDGIGGGAGGILGAAMAFGIMISIAWPLIVLILMTRPSAKAACTNF